LLVPVVGLDALGKPLTAGQVHRPELVASLAGAALGDQITPEMIAGVLAHPSGGAKGLTRDARLVPFLNKAEDATMRTAARRIARLLLKHPFVDSVIIGAAQGVDPACEVWGRVGAVVLAAGQGKRFGALKQLLPWHGEVLVAHVAAQALTCTDIDRVAATVGAGADRVAAALAGKDVRLVSVPDWAEGQSRSVQAGLRALAGMSAVLFLQADQPGVTPDLLSALIQRHRETLAPIVAPRFRGQRGNPVLFDRSTFAEFVRLTGDVGARPIIEAHSQEIAWVDWATPEILEDIDRAEDYQPENGQDRQLPSVDMPPGARVNSSP
jgi:molybdenum cofactor cytidylyltransferase